MICTTKPQLVEALKGEGDLIGIRGSLIDELAPKTADIGDDDVAQAIRQTQQIVSGSNHVVSMHRSAIERLVGPIAGPVAKTKPQADDKK